MYKEKKILALIPARGGSRGLARKNITLLSGKPLVVWTIEQAKGSKYVDRIIVSTDDAEIAEISKEAGAEVPFLRPSELATDQSKGMDVILHAIEWMEKNEGAYELIVDLQPTSPLRRAEDIDRAIELLFSKKAQAIVSVCETEHPALWSNVLPEDGCMKDFIRPEVTSKNRQELPRFYRLNGSVFVAYSSYLKEQKSFFGEDTFAYIMPKEVSIDIDDVIDFKLAEILMDYCKQRQKQ